MVINKLIDKDIINILKYLLIVSLKLIGFLRNKCLINLIEKDKE